MSMGCFACFGGGGGGGGGEVEESRREEFQGILRTASTGLKPFVRHGSLKDDYTVSRKVLGYGLWGSVKMGSTSDGAPVAVKTLSKAMLAKRPPRVPPLVELECHAAATACGEGRAAELLAVYEDDRSIYVVMEQCAGGDLFEYWGGGEGDVEGEEIHRVATELLQVLASLHTSGVVHRDVKPENILHARKRPGGGLKLCDFGSAARLPGEGARLRDFVSTAYYAAPEVFACEYGVKADVWGAGVVLYVMLMGAPPAFTRTTCVEDPDFRALQEGKPRLPGSCPAGLRALILSLLAPREADRPTAAQALQHEWLTKPPGPQGTIADVSVRFAPFLLARKLQQAAVTLLAVVLSPAATRELAAALQGRRGLINFQELRGLCAALKEDDNNSAARLDDLCQSFVSLQAGVGVGALLYGAFDTAAFLDVISRRRDIVACEGEDALDDVQRYKEEPGGSYSGTSSTRWVPPEEEQPGGSVGGLRMLDTRL